MTEQQKRIVSYILAILYIVCSIAIGLYTSYKISGNLNDTVFVMLMCITALTLIAILVLVVHLLAELIYELFL